MFCKSCGSKHENEENEEIEMNLEIDDEEEGDKSKLDILRELIQETKNDSGKRLASGGAVVRPLPISTSKPAPPPPKPQEIAFTDEEEDSDFDAEDFRSRFKRKV